MALRLARAGYGGGDPERIMHMRADYVLAMLQFEIGSAEYEEAYITLNQERDQ